MPYKNIDILTILSENEVHWKIIFCPKRRYTHNEYRISIELKDNKRQYTCVCFEELCELIKKIPIEKRCLYEHISRGDSVKFYLDYEYYRTIQNAIIDVNKALLSIQKLFINLIKIIAHNNNISIHDMLILRSSSSEKESYHLILSDKNVRFSSTHCLYLFIEEILRIMLIASIEHECSENRKYSGKQINNESSLSEIIDAFNCIRLEWFACINCKVKHLNISVSDVCNLFVYDKNGHLIPCIDMKVYGIEQDFRIFMCTKTGENRPLLRSTMLEEKFQSDPIEVCGSRKELNINSMEEILQRSLITEPSGDNSYYIDIDDFYKWTTSVGFNVKKKRNQYFQDEINIKKTHIIQHKNKTLSRTDRELCAELWTKSYLKTIGSSGLIHSINTGKYGKLVLCNIQNMNVCKNSHVDYFNDSTIYINSEEKTFSIRCNRIPCKEKPWEWQPMI